MSEHHNIQQQDDNSQMIDDNVDEDTQDIFEGADLDPAGDANTEQRSTKKRKGKEPQTLTRVPGKSIFPVSRVQKILKADKELPMVTREAVLLVSLATEEFICRLSQASHSLAVRENRVTVQRKDVASAVRRADEFWFLEEFIPLYEEEPTGKRKPKALQEQKTTLHQFVSKPQAAADEDEPEMLEEDVVMNDDGTMTLDPR
ncbi:hypothetical protein BDW22DRAFT_61152 [Trametopsis cervina]|nr:hypothetical protein BDW22DRAFT_61152 [Trametopsis cervina]